MGTIKSAINNILKAEATVLADTQNKLYKGLFGSGMGDTCQIGRLKMTELVIPDGVKVIGDRAFDNCTALKSLTLPEGLEKIEERAFYGCESLTELVVPEGVTEIGTNAFGMCTHLTKLTLPSTLDSIGATAFYLGAGCTITFNKTMAEVKAMANYPWSFGTWSNSTFVCTDGSFAAGS
jgi:hypothetical protein